MNKFCLRVVTLKQYIDEQLGEESMSCRLPRLPEREGTSTTQSKRSPACSLAGFWLFPLIDLSASRWALSHWDVTTEDTGRIKENCRVFQLEGISETIYDFVPKELLFYKPGDWSTER